MKWEQRNSGLRSFTTMKTSHLTNLILVINTSLKCDRVRWKTMHSEQGQYPTLNYVCVKREKDIAIHMNKSAKKVNKCVNKIQ
jgi:hypothetical protein